MCFQRSFALPSIVAGVSDRLECIYKHSTQAVLECEHGLVCPRHVLEHVEQAPGCREQMKAEFREAFSRASLMWGQAVDELQEAVMRMSISYCELAAVALDLGDSLGPIGGKPFFVVEGVGE